MRQIRSALPAPRRTLDRRIVGSPEYVRACIQHLQAQGRLVYASPWDEVPEGVQCSVRFVATTAAAAPAPARRRRWPLVAGACAVGGTALSVAAYALIQLVNAVIAALPVIGGGLLLLALAAVVARGRSPRTFTFTGTGRMD